MRSSCAGLPPLGYWVCAHAFTWAATWRAPLLDHPLEDLVYWREALVRATRAVFGASLTGIAAWQFGRHLTRRANPLSMGPMERGQFTLAIGAVALSTVLHGLSYVGAYRPHVVVGLLARLWSDVRWRDL